MRDSAFPALACGTWLLAATLMAAPLQAHLSAGLDPQSLASGDPLGRMIGSFKEAVGDLAFLKADSYYHGGARHLVCEEEHADHDHDHDHEEEEAAPPITAPGDWVSRVAARVSPTEDRHARGEELAELVPLLAVAARLDPHHVTAILTTAYWLDTNLNRTDEAIQLLERGVRDNPQSWQAEAALGQMLFEKRDDPILAAEHLESAIHKLTGADAELFERRRVWMLLAQAYERSGRTKKALTAYRQTLTFFAATDPESAREGIRSNIARLEPVSSD